MKLANKVALITGAGSGIGQATARLFAREGASVAVMDFNAAAAAATTNEINANGGKAAAITGDVSVEADVQRMIEQTVARFGRLDVLYNNAGIVNQPMLRMMELPLEHFERVMAVNTRGVYLGIKHAVPHMKRDGGSIINTASQAAFEAVVGLAPYCASKAAVVSLTQVAALEYAPWKIRVNCICPGIIDTPLLRRHRGADGDEYRSVGEQRAAPQRAARGNRESGAVSGQRRFVIRHRCSVPD